jgi:cytochrome c
MKKIAVLAIAILVGFACVLAYAQKEGEKEMPKPDPAKEMTAAVERGKALFGDTKLGTTGMSCNSCHMKGGTMDGEMGDMTVKAFDALSTKYPKYWMMAKKVMTLDQVINWCIVNPLKGTALAWDDQRLTDLAAYCASVTPVKEEVKEEKKKE